MHPYSININDKVKVYWIIVPLSLLSGYFVNQIILKNFSFYQIYSWIIGGDYVDEWDDFVCAAFEYVIDFFDKI